MACIECDAHRAHQATVGSRRLMRSCRSPGLPPKGDFEGEPAIRNCSCECHDPWKILQGGKLARSVRERQPS